MTGLVVIIVIGTVVSFFVGNIVGYRRGIAGLRESVSRAFEKGCEQGKKEALADAYREPAPPALPPRKGSPLEESLERMAQVIVASGIDLADRD